ncbi:hypothetical protein [Methylomonas sp. AM2-LC]|uniref:hypothetical protein n=1 Tax=Methylomonas sp. AM2-LC TaxID=3153301 RepID=UPI003265A97D
MKNSQLNQRLLIALLLSTSVAHAEDYPAANFQPKVIYSTEAVATTSTASTSTPCEPKATKSSQVEQTQFDAKYPAASFQPKVIYSNQGS